MRRRIIWFLLLLLPIQFAWAAAAKVCTHETGNSSLHFGHHLHVHNSDSSTTPAEKLPAPGNTVSDLDCPICHFGGVTPIKEFHAGFAPRATSHALPEPILEQDLPWVERPDRPNWRYLALIRPSGATTTSLY